MSNVQPLAKQRGRRRQVVLYSFFGIISVLILLLVTAEPRSVITPDQDIKSSKYEIFQIDIDRIVGVSLTGRGRDQPLTMWRGDVGWKIDGVSASIPISEYRINDILYSFGSLHAERALDQGLGNYSQFGLEPPSVIAVATLDDQSTIKVFLGNKTPTGNTWYLMVDGGEQVYTVWAHHGDHYHYTLEDLRGDELPSINYSKINYLSLEQSDISYWEIVETNPLDTRFTNLISRYALTKPYVYPRAINNDELNKLVSLIKEFNIDRVVVDSPSSPSDYGLLNPRFELTVRDVNGNAMQVWIGNQTEKEVFFAFADRQTIYATSLSNTRFLDVSSFDLMDKFVLILNIDVVDAIEIEHSNGKNRLAIERISSGDNVAEVFSIDDVQVKDKPFRKLYQLFIGLLADGELPLIDRPSVLLAKPEVLIHFFVNTPMATKISITLSSYNRQFYAAIRDDVPEFLVSRAQVARLLQGLTNYTSISD